MIWQPLTISSPDLVAGRIIPIITRSRVSLATPQKGLVATDGALSPCTANGLRRLAHMADDIINVPCYQCKVAIHMPQSVNSYLRASRADFWCINGHRQCYSQQPSEADLVRKQLDEERRKRERAEQNVAMYADDARHAREQAQRERNRANGYKGHATRMTKRVKAGTCPCCNRTFKQLAAHMANKHPTFTPIEIEQVGATVQ